MDNILDEYENKFDILLYQISDKLCPYAKDLGMTPNIITTLSNVFCIITLILLLKSYYIIAIFTYIISYYFDCMDGHMARKYKMFTKYGDLYDHISDIIKSLSIVMVLIYINYKKFLVVLPVLILLFIGTNIQLGCQELYKNNKGKFLDFTQNMCPVKNSNDKQSILNVMKYTKYINSGTYNIFICIIFIYYYYN